MSLPVFPALAGQGWSVHKKPTFATTVARHVSAREVRSPNYANPVWQFELTFDALDGAASASYGGLGAQSLQSLMGLFLQCQGQYGAFLYYDPSDYQAEAESLGVGDGTTRSFQLTRTLGGFVEPVTQPFAPNAPTLFQTPGAAAAYAPNNLLSNTVFAGAAAGTPGTLPAPWVASIDAGHGIARQIVGAGYVGGLPYLDIRVFGTDSNSGANLALNFAASFPVATGSAYVGSMYLAVVGGALPSGALGPRLAFDDGGFVTSPATPTGALTRASFARRIASATGTTTFGLWIYGPTTAGTAVDFTLRVCAPQVEMAASAEAAASAFQPTFAAPCYGGPQIAANGVPVDPAGYAIANGIVTFATAPAAGVALSWSGYFGFLCRFDADDLDFEQFMANLWRASSVKFRSLRAQ